MQKYCLHACKHHILCRLYKVKSRNQCSNCWMIISKLAPFQWKNKVSWNAMLQLKGPENEINVGIMQANFVFTGKGAMSFIVSKSWSIFGSVTCRVSKRILMFLCESIAICFLCQYKRKTLDHWEWFHSNPKKRCLKNQYQRLVCWYSLLQQYSNSQ